MVGDLDWRHCRIAEVGAGTGAFSRLIGGHLRTSLKLDPAEHVFACDLMPESYGYDAVPCRATGADGRLPFDDDEFDVVISVEVIEHVENQFEFMREATFTASPHTSYANLSLPITPATTDPVCTPMPSSQKALPETSFLMAPISL